MAQALSALPIDFRDLRAALIGAFSEAVGIAFITAEPEVVGAPRPQKPYGTTKFTGPAKKYGYDERRMVLSPLGAPTDTYNCTGQRTSQLDVNFYGNSHEEAYNYALLLQVLLDAPALQEELSAAGMSVMLNGEAISDLSQLLETGYEGRAHMELMLGFAVNYQIQVGSIGTVELAGTLTDGVNTITIDNVITGG